MFRKLVVDTIVKESTTIKSFYLKPSNGRVLKPYLPGQFVPVRIPLDTESIIRNYTISDWPGNDHYRITVKRENRGKASRYLHDNVKEGHELEVGKPMGNFTLSMETEIPVILLSGGVGITPMLSMLEFIAKNQPKRTVYFIHSSTNSSVQPMIGRLRELEKQHSNIHLFIHHSRPHGKEVPQIDFDNTGLIEMKFLESVLKGVTGEYYLCGPIGFMETMYGYLQQMDVDWRMIHYEFFGEGKLLEGNPIFTDSKSESYTINFKESGKSIVWNEKASNILEVAEANGIFPNFSCRTGSCGTCEAKILSGNVEYDFEPFIPVMKGKALTCCAKPSSDLTIEL